MKKRKNDRAARLDSPDKKTGDHHSCSLRGKVRGDGNYCVGGTENESVVDPEMMQKNGWYEVSHRVSMKRMHDCFVRSVRKARKMNMKKSAATEKRYAVLACLQLVFPH
jgi:hypothetical protein